MRLSVRNTCALALMAAAMGSGVVAGDLRIGIIGCDTSHAVAFAENLNNPGAKDHVAGGRVVGAVKGGSPDIASSWSRVGEYSAKLSGTLGVKFYDTIDELCGNVDVVLLESVDGRPHLQQLKPVLRARKPVFIDKPAAGSLADVIEMFRLIKAAGVPAFSSSALRFAADTQKVHGGSIGKVRQAETYGPCEIEPHHPDLFWYGVHGTESLFTLMGRGCEKVHRSTTPGGKIEVVGTWNDGRVGTMREDGKFHGVAHGEKGDAAVGSFDGYVPLVVEIMKFFKTGVAPVSPEETIEMFAFMEAADESKRQNGAEVSLSEVIRKNSATK